MLYAGECKSSSAYDGDETGSPDVKKIEVDSGAEAA